MTDSAVAEVAPSPPQVVKIKPATSKSAKKSSKSTEKSKRKKNKATLDANGFPKSLTPEQSTWLDNFNEEFMGIPTDRDKRKEFFDRTFEGFKEKYAASLIENSEKTTREVSG